MKQILLASYADDNSIYATDDTMEGLLKKLTTETNIVLEWFTVNEMKANENKSHLFLVNGKNENVKIGNTILTSEKNIKLLGLKIDHKLQFKNHVNDLIKKGNQKFHALSRISKYISFNKLKILMQSFIISQFNYCSLIWMFNDRMINNRINRLHARALRLVHRDKESTFVELLRKSNDLTIHQKHIQKLALEMFKVKNQISPEPIQNLFKNHSTIYNLRNIRTWNTRNVRTVHYGLDTLAVRGPHVWENVPKELQNLKSIKEFKRKVKTWRPDFCTCRLCKIYIHNIGYIQ